MRVQSLLILPLLTVSGLVHNQIRSGHQMVELFSRDRSEVGFVDGELPARLEEVEDDDAKEVDDEHERGGCQDVHDGDRQKIPRRIQVVRQLSSQTLLLLTMSRLWNTRLKF